MTVDGHHAALADCSLDAYYPRALDVGFDTSLVNVSKLLHYKRLSHSQPPKGQSPAHMQHVWLYHCRVCGDVR